MTPLELQNLRELLIEYCNIFAVDQTEVTIAVGYEYEIQMDEERVVNHKVSRMNPIKRAFAQEHVDKMLKAGTVEPLGSPYNSRVVLVNKKDEGYRFCVDLRDLNKITRPIAFVLPTSVYDQ